MDDEASAPIVLVVEDSVLVALAVEAALEDRGFVTIVAGSLAAAAERLGGTRPAAALVDLQLPDGDALGLVAWLNDLGCPVALCTGSEADVVPPGLAVAAHFRKPVAAETLAEWVAQVVGGEPADS